MAKTIYTFDLIEIDVSYSALIIYVMIHWLLGINTLKTFSVYKVLSFL